MKRIPLTGGKCALVDDADYVYLSQWRWYLYKAKRQKTEYAVRQAPRVNGVQRTVRMHRLLLCANDRDLVDHIDGDGLNNQRTNLRLCGRSGNAQNRRRPANNKSGYKGVYWYSRTNKWRAQIGIGGKTLSLGYYLTAAEAARAYDKAAKEHFGEFSNMNF